MEPAAAQELEWRREAYRDPQLIRRMAAVPKPTDELMHPTMARIYKGKAESLMVPEEFITSFHASVAASPLTECSACSWRGNGDGMVCVMNFTTFLGSPSGIGKSNVITWLSDHVLDPYCNAINCANVVTNYTLEALKKMIAANVSVASRMCGRCMPPPCSIVCCK